jgi:capsular polysaccharide transport system ATP-binding protein
MIVFDNVAKSILRHGRRRLLLATTSLRIPSDRRIALVSADMADTVLLINLIAGQTLPTSGRIIRRASVSFPVGLISGLDPQLSVRTNVEHVARLYDADVKAVTGFVRTVAGMGAAFDKPLRLLPRQDRLQLGQIVAYSLPFDVYVLSAPLPRDGSGSRPSDKVARLAAARARDSGMIIPSRNFKAVPEICDMVMVLGRGRLHLYDDVAHAQLAFQQLEPA